MERDKIIKENISLVNFEGDQFNPKNIILA